MKRICLWSGPRNVSTALMYSFAQRSDTTVIDEPLYGAYLSRTGYPHPGREIVTNGMENDASKVVEEIILGDYDSEILFVKSMAHHLLGIDSEFVVNVTNVILTRDPQEMLPSLINQIPEPTLDDTGLPEQVRLLRAEAEKGSAPPVLDARELLLNPEKVLQRLCSLLSIEFQGAMLSWPAGKKEYDGIWAPFWYHNVHKSTGFAPYKPKDEPFPERLIPLLQEAAPLYDELYSYAIKAGDN